MIGRALTVEDVFVKNDEERRLYELLEKGRLEFENAMFAAERRGELIGELRGMQTRPAFAKPTQLALCHGLALCLAWTTSAAWKTFFTIFPVPPSMPLTAMAPSSVIP